jgi:1,4-dihydroxy-2-naphthoate octaprenyltransferase
MEAVRMKIVLVSLMAMMLGACSATTGKDIIRGANTIKAIGNLSKAGMIESATNCTMDIFDPANRGSGC